MSSSIGEAKDLFDDVGAKYEAIFGQNEGQIDFVRRSLDLVMATGAGAGDVVMPSVLDIGQGTGQPTSAMAAARGCRVHGIDVSPVMVELARRHVPAGSFEVASMLEWEPSPSTLAITTDATATATTAVTSAPSSTMTTTTTFDAAFAIFSLFQFAAPTLKLLPARFARWVRPGGHLFVGVIAVEDFPPGIFRPSAEDPEIGLVTRKFMGKPETFTIATRKGWADLFEGAGFRVVGAEMVPFQPADCDLEPHYYITCQRVG